MADSAVLFDFEGTLVDFQWRLEPAEAELRDLVALAGFSRDDFADLNYAMIWNRVAERLGPEDKAVRAELCAVYDRYDADALSRWSPRPGAEDVLAQIASLGYAVAVVSNVGRTALEAALDRFGLRRSLDEVVSRNDVPFMKPRPDALFHALSRLGVPPSRAVLVGDSVSDVRAGREAGVRVLVITGGETDPSRFSGEDVPDGVVDDLAQIPGMLDRSGNG